jgi:hypothetical protein
MQGRSLLIVATFTTTAVVGIYVPVLLQHLYPPPLLGCLVFFAILCYGQLIKLAFRRAVGICGRVGLYIGAVLFREVTCLGLEELGAEITCVCVGITALSWLSALQSGMRGQQSLMVGGSSLGFFATCGIECRSVSGRHGVGRLLGLCW